MRDFGMVSPRYWTGATGKALRGDLNAQLIGVYLMTSPHSNMIGVYHLPISYIAADLGIPLEGASKGLRRLIEDGFCQYDEQSETVFVVNMAEHQIGETLKVDDKRRLGVIRQFKEVRVAALRRGFLARYAEHYRMREFLEPGDDQEGHGRGLEAPPKQLTGTGTGTGTGSGSGSGSGSGTEKTCPSDSGSAVEILLKDGTSAAFSPAQIAELASDWPGIDVLGQLRLMRNWAKSNPGKRKTRAGIRKFVNGWLGRYAKEREEKAASGKAGNAVGGLFEKTEYTSHGTDEDGHPHHDADGYHDHHQGDHDGDDEHRG